MKDWTSLEIEEFRKSHRLTRKKLGEFLGGVTVSTIFKWEKGVRAPSKTARFLLSKIEEEMNKKGGEKAWGKGPRKKAR